MARPRTINRETLLDTAEVLLQKHGAPCLSFGAIAAESGLSKASVQSAFGTREQMLDALLGRWMGKEQERFNAIAGENPDDAQRLHAHIKATKEEASEASSRILSLLAAQIGSGTQSESMLAWYRDRLGTLEANDAEARKRRIAYLAVEGAILVRDMVGYQIDDALWAEIFDDLDKFAQS